MKSKELLSELLNIENERISRIVDKFYFPNTNTIAVQYYMTDGWQHMNIYELAHKCKEWALANGFAISSGVPKPFYKKRIIGAEIFKLTDFRNAVFMCYQESEHEAIFQACEWILKDKR